MSEILFEITKDNLETGMRGYPVGFCTTSYVDPQKGLFYMGRPVSQMKDFSPIQIIYLLYHGEEGSEEQVAAFSKIIQERSSVNPKVIDAIYSLPKEGHPMELFASAVQILGMVEKKDDYREDCLNLIAKAPIIAAAVINYHAGWGKVTSYHPEKGYMENFTDMLLLKKEDPQQLASVLRLFNILHYDHGGGNLSTFVGKAVASGLQNLYGAISAAMNALAGPRHGKANQDCLEFVKQVLKQLGENATPQQMEQLLRERLQKKELIYGFGHAVLRVEDARATLFYNFAKEKFPQDSLLKISLLLREVGTKILSENPKITDPFPNVDIVSGSVLTAGGFAYPEYFTVLFGLSRVVGIAIQIVYERLEAREGKGTPIVRPKYLFKPKDHS